MTYRVVQVATHDGTDPATQVVGGSNAYGTQQVIGYHLYKLLCHVTRLRLIYSESIIKGAKGEV